MDTAARALRLLTLAESIAAAAAYALVASLLIGDVLGREVLGKGIFGAQKMAVYCAIVAAFLGLSLATSANMQLRPSFLDHLLQGPMVDRIGDAFAAGFYIFMAVVAIMFIQQSMEFQDRAAVLYWLLWPIQLIIPYALCSTGIRHGAFALWPALKPAERGAA